MPPSFAHTRILLGVPNVAVRSALRMALHSHGYRAIGDTGNFVALHDLLQTEPPDLLITAAEIDHNDTGYLVREIRNQRLGGNPFVVVLLLLATADPEAVKLAIDCGADDLMLMPVAPAALLARIDKLSRARKPFIATHDYIGPDRRGQARPGPHSAPTMEPPNPLAARLTNGADTTRLDADIRAAAVRLNDMKVERMAAQAAWLVNTIVAGVRDGMAEGDLLPHVQNLPPVAEDILARIAGGPSESHAGIVGQLLDQARQLEAAPASISATKLEQLQQTTIMMVRTVTRRQAS